MKRIKKINIIGFKCCLISIYKNYKNKLIRLERIIGYGKENLYKYYCKIVNN